MRKVLFNTHLVTAWAAGLVLIILSITGVLLIYEKNIDVWVDPGLYSVAAGRSSLSLDKVVQIAGLAGAGTRIKEIHLGGPGRSIMAVTDRDTRVYVDGHTGSILGTRKGALPSVRLRQFHKNLLLGRTGGWMVVASSFLLILQSATGLYLWWPLKRITIRAHASGRRLAFDLHHALGFFSSIFICLVTVTGLIRYYPEITNKLFHQAALPPTETSASALHPSSHLSIDEAVAIARQQFPGSGLVRVNLPEHENDPFVVSARYPGDASPFGLSWVNLDRHDGSLLLVQDVRFESEADWAQRVDRSIHTGEIGGLPTRGIAALTCLAVLVEIWTGMWMWWKRSRLSRSRARVVPSYKRAPLWETARIMK